MEKRHDFQPGMEVDIEEGLRFWQQVSQQDREKNKIKEEAVFF